MSINPTDLTDAVVADAISAAVGAIVRTFKSRKQAGMEIARWRDTYRLTGRGPDLPELEPEVAGRLRQALNSDEVQAALQSLLAARLTDAPETQAGFAREAVRLAIIGTGTARGLAKRLCDYYDDEICEIVGQLKSRDPSGLQQVRSEAFGSRIVAILNAIERQVAALAVPGTRSEEEFLKGYREHVQSTHGKIRPPDFQERRHVPIAEIYVETSIIPHGQSDVPYPRHRSAPTLLTLVREIDRTVLLGDPGGGKTTAANVLAHDFASDHAQRIPFLVTLRDYAAQDPPERSIVQHIEHTLATLYQCRAPAGVVDRLLVTGRALVIFDGLDELLDTARRRDVSERVEQFCVEYPLAPVLVTSRLIGYEQARLDDEVFTCYRLDGFTDDHVAAYAQKWFALQGEALDAKAFLHESTNVEDLRSNPLLLSLMCILYRGEGSLPRDRAGVYEKCADLLFRQWDTWRRIHRQLRAGHLVEPAIRHLAWWLFTGDDPQAAVTEQRLISETAEFFRERGFEWEDEARDVACEFVEFCRGRMWVFTDTGTTADGEKLYAFTHRTFLEYFAAARVASVCDTPEDLAQYLLPRLEHSRWSVVAELAIQIKARATDRGADRVYAELLAAAGRRPLELEQYAAIPFLMHCLDGVDLSPGTIRDLTRATLNRYGTPFSLIRTGRRYWRPIGEELADHVCAMISSDDSAARNYGLQLGAEVAFNRSVETDKPPGSYDFWTRWSSNHAYKYATELVAMAEHNATSRTALLYHGVLQLTDALAMPGGLRSLMDAPQIGPQLPLFPVALLMKLFRASWIAPIGDVSTHQIRTSFEAIGCYLLSHPESPWGVRPRKTPADLGGVRMGSYDPQLVDPWTSMGELSFLGIAAVAFATAEMSHDQVKMMLAEHPTDRSPGLLRIYLAGRLASADDLPDLPVPDQFRTLFRDWAARRVSFMTG